MIDHYKKANFFVNLGGHEILSDKVSPQLKQKTQK
jgi:hypothetical protein